MIDKKIILGIVLALVIGSVLYLESTTPDQGEVLDADIDIRDLQMVNNSDRIEAKSQEYELAKELVQPEGYVNTEEINISEHIGKDVILVDFWTYSCINCQRTLPYLNSWYEKYKDEGLVIIGVHTPEFEFEKDIENLKTAALKWGIKYPVVQDNDRQTWRAYNNRYWPRKYLIDIDGFIVYDHIGEGAYAETEEKIQELILERSLILGLDGDVDTGIVSHDVDKGTSSGRTKEIYFGYGFARDQLGNSEGWVPGKTIGYILPQDTKRDSFYLEGSWKNNEDNMELVGEKGKIHLDFTAKNINIVAGAESEVGMTVLIDGKEIGNTSVKDHDLYVLYSGDTTEEHSLEIITENGFQAYTFTFG